MNNWNKIAKAPYQKQDSRGMPQAIGKRRLHKAGKFMCVSRGEPSGKNFRVMKMQRMDIGGGESTTQHVKRVEERPDFCEGPRNESLYENNRGKEREEKDPTERSEGEMENRE